MLITFINRATDKVEKAIAKFSDLIRVDQTGFDNVTTLT